MMGRWGVIPALLAAGAALVLVLGVRRDLREPHLRLFSDMVYSPAYKSQYPNPALSGGRTQQRPPEGTIARDEVPFPFGPSEAERKRAGKELKNPVAPSLEALTRGRFVFESQCSHCHGAKGAGDGAVAKVFPGFSFPINSPATLDLPDGTLFHIITYGRNLMPAHRFQVPAEDRWKAILYLRDLERQELARLGPLARIPEDPRRRSLVSAAYGKELFASNCAACHGAEGKKPQPGIPMLNSPAVLAIAPDSYYWDIINHGRPGTAMAAWDEVLTPTQIQSVVAYIRSFAPPTPEPAQTASLGGDPAHGRSLFSNHCAGCHGLQGKGGIGNSLTSPSFLAIASDDFLRRTIALGRNHTAMPASYDFKAQDVSDLAAYIRSFAKPAPPFEEVRALLPDASLAAGKAVFAARCAGCHGEDGAGGLGSKLSDPQFLSMLDDRALYRIVSRGRPGTAMPAWGFLGAKDLADVLKYLRSWQTVPSVAGSTWTARGRAEFGEVLFKTECAKCHGPHGEGDLGAQIGNPAFLAEVSDEFLRRTISFGKRGTEMKGFATRARNPLSEEDIGHLIAYLRSLEKRPGAAPLMNTMSWAVAKEGQKVYEKKAECAKCHGPQGEGASGPSLGNPAFLDVASNGFLTATIVLGREDTPMPAFYHGKVRLEQEEVENVIAYIRGFSKAAGRPTRRVPVDTVLAAAGGILYRDNCARCHGEAGKGKHGSKPGEFAPSLNNKEFLKAADDNFLLATIALGRPGTPMPPFGVAEKGRRALSADEIRVIVAFLRSWEGLR